MQTMKSIRKAADSVNNTCVKANALLDLIQQIFSAITNSGVTQHVQDRVQIINTLQEKFNTVKTFEKKKDNLMRDIFNYKIGNSLSAEFNNKYIRLQSKLDTYDSDKGAMSEAIRELQQNFQNIAAIEPRFFNKNKDLEKINKGLSLIQNKLDPLYIKAIEINRLLDDVCSAFSLEQNQDPTMEGGCCLLI